MNTKKDAKDESVFKASIENLLFRIDLRRENL
jgi:hypothetical protein